MFLWRDQSPGGQAAGQLNLVDTPVWQLAVVVSTGCGLSAAGAAWAVFAHADSWRRWVVQLVGQLTLHDFVTAPLATTLVVGVCCWRRTLTHASLDGLVYFSTIYETFGHIRSVCHDN